MNSLSRSRAFFGIAVVVALAAGCSDTGVKKITVSGTVSYKGQTLQSGILKFVGPEWYFASVIQPDGTFVMTDVVPGEVKIAVMDSPVGSGSSSDPNTKVAAPKGPPVSLPAKFREPETSGVTYTITPDTKNLAIELK